MLSNIVDVIIFVFFFFLWNDRKWDEFLFSLSLSVSRIRVVRLFVYVPLEYSKRDDFIILSFFFRKVGY